MKKNALISTQQLVYTNRKW